jgi:hypothetical protein
VQAAAIVVMCWPIAAVVVLAAIVVCWISAAAVVLVVVATRCQTYGVTLNLFQRGVDAGQLQVALFPACAAY